MRARSLVILLLAAGVAGCTTIAVRKVDAAKYPLDLVCIEENPAVLVSELLLILEDGFQRHNIKTLVYRGKAPDGCRYTLWYTAYRAWDLAPFVRRVELRLRLQNETIGSATYSHSGGLALNKWASAKSKVDPVLDELLSEFRR